MYAVSVNVKQSVWIFFKLIHNRKLEKSANISTPHTWKRAVTTPLYRSFVEVLLAPLSCSMWSPDISVRLFQVRAWFEFKLMKYRLFFVLFCVFTQVFKKNLLNFKTLLNEPDTNVFLLTHIFSNIYSPVSFKAHLLPPLPPQLHAAVKVVVHIGLNFWIFH